MIESVVDQLQYDGGPTVLILSDTDEGASRGARAVSVAGGRVVASARLDQGHFSDDLWIPCDTVFVSIEHGATIKRPNAEAWIERLGDETGPSLIVTTPLSALDEVAAIVMETPAVLLCDANLANTAFELVQGWFGAAPTSARDISSEVDPLRLQRLADEVGRVAKVLANLAALEPLSPVASQTSVGDVHRGFIAEPVTQPLPRIMAPEIRAMLRRRRIRGRFFDAALFADPAWDMLLDLMAARLEGEQVAVSSLCIAAAVPPTTALRWIRAMTEQGLFERHDDPKDGRRIFIRLTDACAQAMNAYFMAVESLEGLPA